MIIKKSIIDKNLNSDKKIPFRIEDNLAKCEYKSPISTSKAHKNLKILDREMGILRNNSSKLVFLKNIFCDIRRFFTMKKINDVKELSLYKKALINDNKTHGKSPLNIKNDKNKQLNQNI